MYDFDATFLRWIVNERRGLFGETELPYVTIYLGTAEADSLLTDTTGERRATVWVAALFVRHPRCDTPQRQLAAPPCPSMASQQQLAASDDAPKG
jgi:hypothetical protein